MIIKTFPLSVYKKEFNLKVSIVGSVKSENNRNSYLLPEIKLVLAQKFIYFH